MNNIAALVVHIYLEKLRGDKLANGKITCKNVFKNTERKKLKEQFNKMWIELINECERNKLIFQK